MARRVTALSVAVILAVAGCGGGGADNPIRNIGVSALQAQLEKNGIPADQARCVAKALDKAGLNVRDFTNISTGSTPKLSSSKLRTYTRAVTACATATSSGNGG